ncbi:MAG: 1-(5-phosphoribosyl)-5-[(5-phosphoribosylamino)methylideneamino]imidazole-4-carboxamide isomerase [Candidatus Bathyarchaeota archaeon]|nr:1-(5-phosphoribosyl)-5-[(5-phosphoribosylamino)methylideneamino]imidazole-4-carboxamide isomerase [Candidatus Bathyarchaeota archaeon]
MQVIPAIDLMQGRVVRLTRGDPNQAKFYDAIGTPVEVAKKWQAEGAQRLHIIDLDAAFGKPDNLKVVAKIAQATGLPIQVGGGIRTVEAAEKLLSAGIQYVILGALAFKDPAAIKKLQEKFSSDRVIVALDNKDGKVMVEGWTSSTAFTLTEALKTYAGLGAETFLITSITKDGTLSGPDLDTLNQACRDTGASVIAAGGIGGLNDLVALKRVGVQAAVVGKALYEGRFTLKEAIKTVTEN